MLHPLNADFLLPNLRLFERKSDTHHFAGPGALADPLGLDGDGGRGLLGLGLLHGLGLVGADLDGREYSLQESAAVAVLLLPPEVRRRLRGHRRDHEDRQRDRLC